MQTRPPVMLFMALFYSIYPGGNLREPPNARLLLWQHPIKECTCVAPLFLLPPQEATMMYVTNCL